MSYKRIAIFLPNESLLWLTYTQLLLLVIGLKHNNEADVMTIIYVYGSMPFDKYHEFGFFLQINIYVLVHSHMGHEL